MTVQTSQPGGRFGRLFWSVLALALMLAVGGTTPPAPRSVTAAPEAFSSARAMADVQAIARAPHPTGSPENARVRAYLLQRMAQLGLETSIQVGELDPRGLDRLGQWSGRALARVPLVNLIGVLPGRDRAATALLLMAHHDSVWGSPGAADDTAGVAATLETVRALRQDGTPRRDLIVVFTDGEELGLQGARLFWSSHPLRAQVGAVINMEARGGGGRTTMFQTSRGNGAAVRVYADAVRRPAASSLAAFVYSVLPNDTDLTEVLKGPATAYNFAFIGRPGLYHSPLATPAALDEGALQDMGGQVLDLSRALLRARELPRAAPDVVFFDLFGRLTVVYPAWVGWLLLAAASAAFALAIRRDGTRGMGAGAARMIGLLMLVPLVLTALNLLSIGGAPVNYYDRLAAIPRLEAMALLASAAVMLLLFGRCPVSRPAQVGAALPLLVLGIAVQALAPTAAYVVALPLLVAALSLHLRLAEVCMVAAAMAIGYLLGLGHQLMQGVGPTLPAAAALPVALATLVLLPFRPGLRRVRTVAGVLLLLALATALWVQLDAPAASRAVYSDHHK